MLTASSLEFSFRFHFIQSEAGFLDEHTTRHIDKHLTRQILWAGRLITYQSSVAACNPFIYVPFIRISAPNA